MYRVTTINVSRKWIEWAEWAASLCTANSPFPGHVYRRHPVDGTMGNGLVARTQKLVYFTIRSCYDRNFNVIRALKWPQPTIDCLSVDPNDDLRGVSE